LTTAAAAAAASQVNDGLSTRVSFILFIHLFIHLFLDFFSISFPFPGGRNGSVYTTAIDADKASGDAV